MFKHRNNQKGFTLIELLVAIAVIIVLGLVIGTAFSHNGTLCKGGYLFSLDVNGNQQQMINSQGTAITCSRDK